MFGSYLEVKNECFGRLEMSFFTFLQIFKWLSWNRFFWKRKERHLKLCKFKLAHRKHFRKWSWSYLELKNKCSELLIMTFFSFLSIFEWWSWRDFLVKQDKALKTVQIKILLYETFYKIVLNLAFFRFLQIFEWRSWKCFLGKWGK